MRRLAKLWGVFSLFGLLGSPAHAIIVGSDFETDLTGWTHEGDVAFGDGSVRIGEGAGGYASFWRAFELLPARPHTLCFDLAPLMQFTDEFGTFPDTFFASLYFVNDLADFDLATGRFDDSLELLDADYEGIRLGDGSVMPGDGSVVPFERWCIDFVTRFRYVIPVFELIDGDFTENSSVRLDNVFLTTEDEPVIPEPAHLVALGLGLSALLRRRARVRAEAGAAGA